MMGSLEDWESQAIDMSPSGQSKFEAAREAIKKVLLVNREMVFSPKKVLKQVANSTGLDAKTLKPLVDQEIKAIEKGRYALWKNTGRHLGKF